MDEVLPCVVGGHHLSPFNVVGQKAKTWMGAALGVQPGVLSSKRAIDPVLGWGLGEDAHSGATPSTKQQWITKILYEKRLGVLPFVSSYSMCIRGLDHNPHIQGSGRKRA